MTTGASSSDGRRSRSSPTARCAWEDGRLSTQRVFYANTKAEPNIPVGTDQEGGCFSPALAAGGGRVALAYQSGDMVAFRMLKAPK